MVQQVPKVIFVRERKLLLFQKSIYMCQHFDTLICQLSAPSSSPKKLTVQLKFYALRADPFAKGASCFQWWLGYNWPWCAISSGGVGEVNWTCHASPLSYRRTPSAVVNIQAPASLVRSDLGLLRLTKPSQTRSNTILIITKIKYNPRFARSDAAWLEPLSTRYAALLMPMN